jgi:uncharacterized protein
MKTLVSGSRGLIGSFLVPFLESQGHEVNALIRSSSEARPGDVVWHSPPGAIELGAIDGFDAVIHLAGENLLGRWTPEKKARIIESRADGTRLLAESLARLPHPPKVMISASATGYYGDRGDEVLTEDSSSGSGFLSEVCRQWEAATEPASLAGIRVANTRFGVVLTPHGGALEKMLQPVRLGLGGKIGSGRQYVSWITIDDLTSAVAYVLDHEEMSGPINLVAPNPVTNAELTRAIGRALSKPAILTVPTFVIKLAYGEMGDETILASARVMPEKLLATEFRFAYPDIDSALRHVLRNFLS